MIDWGKNNTPQNKNDKAPKGDAVAKNTDASVLEVVRNRMYFYSEIKRDHILNLTKSLQQKADDISWQMMIDSTPEPGPIELHIQSYGGCIFNGFAAMDTILKIRKTIPINTYIDGCAASAATFLSIVGTRRYINKHSFMLIHQLSSGMWGKFEDFKDNMENLEMFMNMIKDIYTTHTRIPADMLEDILKKDLWFDAKKCLELGLVDEII